MSLFCRNCPCCEAKIGKCLLLTRKINNASKYKKDYKCFYCPECSSQISKELHVLWEPVLAIVGFAIIYFLSFLTVEYLYFFQNMPLNAKVIPFLFIYIIIFSCLYATLVPLKCYKNNSNSAIEIDNGDNKLLDGFLELDDSIKITPLEKKIIYLFTMLPIFIFTFILLVFLGIMFFK